MSYVKITNGIVTTYPYSVGQLRRDNSNVSFPRTIPVEVMRRYGMHPVITEDIPSYNSIIQKVVTATTPTKKSDSNTWVLTHSVVDLTEEEIEENNLFVAQKNRNIRNRKLEETDFYALSDVTMSDAMATYRQALRDLSDHEDWPHLTDADWPTKP